MTYACSSPPRAPPSSLDAAAASDKRDAGGDKVKERDETKELRLMNKSCTTNCWTAFSHYKDKCNIKTNIHIERERARERLIINNW